jgi:hypothetical protein
MGANPAYVGGPIEDGMLNLGSPTALYVAGKAQKVPVIVGANSMDIGDDLMMIEPAREVARLLCVQQPAFEFRFSYVAESRRAMAKT